MLTAANTTRGAQTFIKAPNNTAFGKVYLNNMDENSFRKNNYGFQNQIELMISNRKTALFYPHSRVSEVPEYRNCLVSKITMIHSSIIRFHKII